MKAVKCYLQRLLSRSDIYIDGRLYMRRWRIVNTKWFGIRIHQILLSDAGRELHCHPWDYLSIILKSGYKEERPEAASFEGGIPRDRHGRLTTETYSRGMCAPAMVFRKAEDLHRLELWREYPPYDHRLGCNVPYGVYAEIPAWTLVFTGPRRRRWGFLTTAGWVAASSQDD